LEIKKIFIHGWSFSSEIWERFKNIGNSVFLDLPFHGNNINFSDKDILNNFSENLFSYIESCDEEVVLIGWSLGATVGVLTALKKPKNLKKIILIGFSPKFKDRQLGHDPSRIKAFMMALRKDFEGTVYNFRETAVGNRFTDIPLPEKNGSIKLLRKFIEIDLTDRLDEIDIPVVLIHGKRDRIINYNASVFCSKKIKNSSLILTDSHHAPFLEMPEIISDTLI